MLGVNPQLISETWKGKAFSNINPFCSGLFERSQELSVLSPPHPIILVTRVSVVIFFLLFNLRWAHLYVGLDITFLHITMFIFWLSQYSIWEIVGCLFATVCHINIPCQSFNIAMAVLDIQKYCAVSLMFGLIGACRKFNMSQGSSTEPPKTTK